MRTFTELQEGVYDPNIFKAIFLTGEVQQTVNHTLSNVPLVDLE